MSAEWKVAETSVEPLRRRGTSALLAAFSLLLASACGSENQPGVRDRSVIASVELSKNEVEFDALGDKEQITYVLRSENGSEVSGVAVSWSSDNPSVAEVSAEGVITALSNGMAEITARARTSQSTVHVLVRQVPTSIEVEPKSLVMASVGENRSLAATARDRNGQALREAVVDWRSKQADVASVDEDGVVTATGAGNAEIVATVRGTELSASTLVEVIPLPAKTGLHVSAPREFVSGVPTQVQVEIRDQGGHRVPGAKHEVSLRLGENPHGGKLGGTLTVNAVDGLATFDDLVLDKAGEGYTLIARVGGLDDAESARIAVLPGPAARLAFERQPGNTTSNHPFSPTVRVEVQDAAGNRVPTAEHEIVLALDQNPSSATLGGSVTAPAVNGLATFGDLRVDKAGSGYTLRARAGALQEAQSQAFDVHPGSPRQLGFLTQPSTATSGEAIAPEVQVRLLDEAGNPTTGTGAVTLSLGQNPAGGTLGGTRSAELVDGIATFSDLRIDRAGAGYTLKATSALYGVAESQTFDIRPGAATRLAFVQQVTNAVSKQAFQPGPRVEVQDSAGNRVADATHAITISLGSNPKGGTLSGSRTVNASGGEAVFSDLSLDRAAEGYTLVARATGLAEATSNAFNVTPGTPHRLAFVQHPEDTPAGRSLPVVQVEVLDEAGNRVLQGGTSVSLGLQPAGTPLFGNATATTVNGVASFSNLRIETAGSGYTLRASSPPLEQATSATFRIHPDTATRLAFSVQPSTVRPHALIEPAVVVEIQDEYGNRVPSSATVALQLFANPAGATLSGGLGRAAVDGLATFPALSLDKIGTGYILEASAGELQPARSNAFSVQGGPAKRLVFRSQPQDGVSGQALAPIVVEMQDDAGNLLPDFDGPVTLSLGKQPGGARLDGSLTVLASGGVATFEGLSIQKAGHPFSLVAQSGTLSSAESTDFRIAPGPAASMRLLSQPADRVAGQTLPALQVEVVDAAGNAIESPASVDLQLLGGDGAVLGGTYPRNTTNGLASFGDLRIEKAGTYSIRVESPGLEALGTRTFHISPAGAAEVRFLAQPTDGFAGAPLPEVQVAVFDAFGNQRSNALSVTLDLFNGPPGASLQGTTTKSGTGVVRFDDLLVEPAARGYQLRATVAGLSPKLSDPFDLRRPGGTDSLRFELQPGNGRSGLALPTFEVAVLDAFGQVKSQSADTIAVSLAAGPAGAILSGPTQAQAVAGIATFSGLSLDKAGTYRFLAHHPNFGSVESAPFTVSAGDPARLAFRSDPADRIAGATLPPLEVAILDAAGNPTTSNASVSLVLIGGAGNVPLHGTHPKAATAGAVTFSDLSVQKAGTYLLRAESGDLGSATSLAFRVDPAAPSQIRFLTQPVDGMKGQPLPPVQLALLDPYENPSAELLQVELELLGTGGTLHGTLQQLFEQGLARFADLSVDASGQDYVLRAKTAQPAIQQDSEPFRIVSAQGATLAFQVQPADGPAGDLAPIAVARLDEGGQVDTSFTGDITLRIASGPADAVLGGTLTAPASAGVAQFSDLRLERAGSYTLLAESDGLPPAISTGFRVDAGAPAHLIFEEGPFNVISGEAMAPALRVAVLDAFGNLAEDAAGTMHLSLDPDDSATLGGASAPVAGGYAVFNALQVDVAGDYMLVATLNGLDSLPSRSFRVDAGKATTIHFAEGPLDAVAGESFGTEIHLLDAAGNRSPDALPITLTLVGGPGGTLAGKTNKAASGGVASFDGLRIDTAGGGYQLEAIAPGLSAVRSQAFTVHPGPAVAIAWIQPPADARSGTPLGPVELEIRDALGNAVESHPHEVELALAPSAPDGATLSGTTQGNPAQGRVLFSDLSIDLAWSHYQLLAQCGALGPFASSYFSIAPGDPAQLAFFSEPRGGRAGAVLDEVAVGILDAAGNLTESTLPVHLALQGGEAGANLTGTVQRSGVEGVATFDDLQIDKGGKGYVLVASAAGIAAPALSTAFDLEGGCPEGYSLCGGVCVDLQTNTAHCGACDNDCEGFACVDGSCDVGCAPGMTLCDDSCVDLRFDPAHCGACDAACGAQEICLDTECHPEPDREQANWPIPPDSPTHYVTTEQMVEDKVTGLIWQRTVLAGAVFNWEAAKAYCANLRVDGRSDWRLPTAIELLSIVDISRTSPAINLGAFRNTPSVSFWSASQNHADPTRAWYVNFSNGALGHNGTGTNYAVRCVRGGKDTPGPRYTLDGETVVDNKTGLIWQRAVEATLRYFDEAEDYCATLDLGGHSDWRLPTKKELESLVWRKASASPAIDSQFFPGVGAWYFWSGSYHPLGTPGTAWRVYFSDGSSSTYTATRESSSYRSYVRCVRSEAVEPPTCTTGEVICGDACVDLQDDPAHCGACNITCDPGERCVTGLCTAESDYDWANWKLPPEGPTAYAMDAETVTDTVTGLVWERHAIEATFSWSDAQTYCRLLGAGGHSDWRVPSQMELLSLVNSNSNNPAITSAFFPNTSSSAFWSSTTRLNDPTYAWYVTFSDGGTSYATKSTRYRVRCVRGGDDFGGKRYEVGERTVLDLRTGLMWQRVPPSSTFEQADAISYCSTLGVDGHDNWRLPTKKELESLVDRRVSAPSLYTRAFLNTFSSYYWTSTDRSGDSNSAWRVHFSEGVSSTTTKTTSHNVRCVRTPKSMPVSCAPGLQACGEACVDLDTDPDFCGACGIRCAEGERCEAGTCSPLPDFEMATWELPPEAPFQYSYPSFFTVEDQRTGLIWQRVSLPKGALRWEDAQAYCRDLRLDDQADWRLPTAIELLSLVDSSRNGQAFNTTAFTGPGTNYWSASESAANPAQAWRINFSSGEAAVANKTSTYNVRCVRGGDGPSGPRYTIEDEIVTDNETGLIWQRHALSTEFLIGRTSEYCATLNAGGYTDWRMPTKKELESLVDRRLHTPAFDETAFPGIPSGSSSNYFWSTTPAFGSSAPYWRVQVTSGAVNSGTTSGSTIYKHFVRCVREPTPDPVSCPGTQVACDNVCVNLETDPFHCGGCTNRCGEEEQCIAGSCEPIPNYEWPTWELPVEAPQSDNYTVALETVTDHTTGLVWQRSILQGITMTWPNAKAYCAGLGLDGHRDWRLPTLMELLSIVSSHRINPAINNQVFENTPNSGVWSGTLRAESTTQAMYVNFASGAASYANLTSTYGVRCVRGGTGFVGPRFEYEEDGDIVRDLGTGLIWQRHVLSKTFYQAEAVDYCESLGVGGYTDWRLPTKKELESIVDRSLPAPAFDRDAFPNVGNTWYFRTGTAYASTSSNPYWRVYASTGASDTVNTTGTSSSIYAHHVRCVRDPTPDPGACSGTQTACGNICTNLDTDPRNCGQCGVVCGEGLYCAAGGCVPEPDRNRAVWEIPAEAPADADYVEDAETVFDQVTGLVWQRTPFPLTLTQTDARAYCRSILLDGHRDWRLPTIIELLSIVDQSRQNPALNPKFNWPASNATYWSDTQYVGSSSYWYLTGTTGTTSAGSTSSSYYVRCVRGGPTTSAQDYVVGVLSAIDPNTGLMWKRSAEANASQEAAITACEALEWDGYDDWRLPTKKELESFVDWSQTSPAYSDAVDLAQQRIFDGTTGYTWTSSYLGNDPSNANAWRVYFTSGATSNTSKTSSAGVRCVRTHTSP